MKISSFSRFRQGFTLIELLLVIGIIAILAAVVIIAINPSKQLADARNAQRRSDVNSILNAVYQYAIDNNGNLPTGIPSGSANLKEVCVTTWQACVNDSTWVDFDVLTGSYLTSMPTDPNRATASGTYYFIYTTSGDRVTVVGSGAELGATISVTR